nr:hypothetical protein [uncultured Holophaga sp.]
MLSLILTAALAVTPTHVKPATNTICPVLGNAVKPNGPKVVVRGHEYLLCCPGCDQELLKNPDKYLKKDGTPKNAKK